MNKYEDINIEFSNSLPPNCYGYGVKSVYHAPPHNNEVLGRNFSLSLPEWVLWKIIKIPCPILSCKIF